jgi:hypothetical protein
MSLEPSSPELARMRARCAGHEAEDEQCRCSTVPHGVWMSIHVIPTPELIATPVIVATGSSAAPIEQRRPRRRSAPQAERRPQIEDNDQTAIEVPAAAVSEELADSTRCRCVPRAESQARRSLLANRLPPPVVAASGWAGRAWCAARGQRGRGGSLVSAEWRRGDVDGSESPTASRRAAHPNGP